MPDTDKILKTVVTTEIDDELNIRSIIFICHVPTENFDLISAMKAAAKDFCMSDEGKRIYSGNGHCFNWGDFDIYITKDYQTKHGFRVIDSVSETIIRDFNEQLVAEEDIFPKE